MNKDNNNKERTDPMATTRFPLAVVKLTGADGNAYGILARVEAALRRAGASKEDLDTFRAEATASDYANLLKVCCAWADVR